MCIRGVVQINFKLLPSLNASMGSNDSKLKGMDSGLPAGYLRPTRCLWLDSFQLMLMLKMHLWQFLCLKSDKGIYGLGSLGKTNKQKSTRKLRPDPKSAVNNGETIWTQSRFGSGHYKTSILQCRELYSVGNHFPPNICNNNFQIFLLIMKQTFCGVLNLTFLLIFSLFN